MNSKTIFLVTSGVYSDYEVHCAFETKTTAESYVAEMMKTETMKRWQVETLELWDCLPVVTVSSSEETPQ